MQTYNYLSNEMPRELIELYNDIQGDVLRLMVNGLSKGIPPEKVQQFIQDKIASYREKTEKVTAITFADSENKTINSNKQIVKEENTEDKALTKNQVAPIVVGELTMALAMLGNLNNRIINDATSRYTTDFNYLKQPVRSVTQKERMKTVINRLAKQGVTLRDVRDNKVRNLSIENVIKRDVIYKVNQANAKVNKENFMNSSAKFIEVSSHPTARTRTKYMKHDYEDHSSWQGKVYYSRDGEKVNGYKEFESTCGYGEMLGICGINCYHQFEMNYTGKTDAEKMKKAEVEKNYALSQEQRKIELAIRKLRQEVAVFEEAGYTDEARKSQSRLKDALSYLQNFCEKNNLKYYNWRTRI